MYNDHFIMAECKSRHVFVILHYSTRNKEVNLSHRKIKLIFFCACLIMTVSLMSNVKFTVMYMEEISAVGQKVPIKLTKFSEHLFCCMKIGALKVFNILSMTAQ